MSDQMRKDVAESVHSSQNGLGDHIADRWRHGLFSTPYPNMRRVPAVGCEAHYRVLFDSDSNDPSNF